MDIKIELERLSTICQGCLSPDRKISPLNAQDKAVFLKLRDEGKFRKGPKQVLLCWECKALLNKMKSFQFRIQKAQHLLVQCLQRFYNKESNLQTLSALKTEHIYQYNHELKHEVEDQPKIILAEKPPHNEEIPQDNSETEIKQEIDTKEEHLSDYDTDNFEPDKEDEDTEFKIKNDVINQKPKIKSSSQKSTKDTRSITPYLKYATVRKSEYSLKKFADCFEMAFLTEQETEEVLKNDKKMKTHLAKQEICKTCNIGYIMRLDLLRHKTFHHSETQYPTSCLACKKQIPTESEMESHWKDFHSTVSRCTLCSELCVKKHMRIHMRRFHTKIFTCNNCLQEFRNLREFSVHYRKMHERVVCDYCNKVYDCKRKLENHIRRYHMPAHCKICNRSFPKYKTYIWHTKELHPVSARPPKELRYCVECDKEFPSIYRVPCPDCNKMLANSTSLKAHYSLIHMKKSKHYCEICKKYFFKAEGLQRHIEAIHQKITLPKNKICDLCGRGFSANRTLANHRRTHTGERPYKCIHCSAAFAQKSAMKIHEKKHKSVIALQPS